MKRDASQCMAMCFAEMREAYCFIKVSVSDLSTILSIRFVTDTNSECSSLIRIVRFLRVELVYLRLFDNSQSVST